MGIIQISVCTNCKKEVPKECDGRIFQAKGMYRKVCRGSDGREFLPNGKFKVIRGFGDSYETELTEIDQD